MGKTRRNRTRHRAVLDRGTGDSRNHLRPEGTRFVQMPAEVRKVLAEQAERFRATFGRDPGPDDTIFFDPDPAVPRPVNPSVVEADTVHAMHAAGIDPALIYAYKVTGLLVTEFNRDLLSDEDVLEWDAAIEEFKRSASDPTE